MLSFTLRFLLRSFRLLCVIWMDLGMVGYYITPYY